MRLLYYVYATFAVLAISLTTIQNGATAEDSGTGEKFEFQAEVSRLMDIIINSLYQKKEIFLREIVSNGCDALDKIRFLSLKNPELLGEGDQRKLEMRISFDEEAKTLSIRDTGIGMTRQDLIDNLGTVAKSGTTNFVEQMAEAGAGDLSLIGQFGVGFYSVYLVADKVEVTSKHNDDDQYIWESTADSTFSVRKDPNGNTLGRGTEIKLFLKEDALEYSNQERLEELLKRYSQFVTFPIYLRKKTTETVEEEAGEAEEEEEDDEEEEKDELEAEDEDEKEETKGKEKKEVTTWNWVQVNEQAAIWARSPEDVTDEEYKAFYKTVSKDYSDPMTWIHFKAEGEIEFKSILFVPDRPPYDLFDNYYSQSNSLKLYVRKVLINDNFEDLMPRYLNFIKGVVDSDDLPLSVSRETLQQHKAIKVMSKKLVRKALDLLFELVQNEKAKKDSEDEEDSKKPVFSAFFEKYGKNLKLGIIEDSANRDKLAKLLRFKSTKSDSGLTGLEDYVERMPEWQKNIYFITGESLESLEASPFLERARVKDVEVLLMYDPIDEYVIQNLPEFEGKKFQSLTKEGLKFGDESEDEKKRYSLYKENFKPLCKWMKDLYADKVEKVIVSNRVTNTPAVLVTGQFGHSANMERIMKSQAFGDPSRAAMMSSKKTMEINPRHPIIAQLAKMSEDSSQDAEAKNIAWLLYDTSLLSSGFDMSSPKEFAERMYKLMKTGLSLDSLELLEEIDIPAESEPETSENSEDDIDSDEKEEL